MKAIIKIDGMMCSKCADRVTNVLKNAGAQEVEISLENRQATVEFDDGSVSLDAMKNAVYDAGYDVIG